MAALRLPQRSSVAYSHWREGLPDLKGPRVTLRELQMGDAPALHALMSSREVARFTWPPPPSSKAFERFIAWSHRERAAGTYICFAVAPAGEDKACGVFELRQQQPGFFRAELGFVVAPRFWGTGVFGEAAQLFLDFAFGSVKVHRIEARAAVQNGRSNAALAKMGAVKEGVLREAFQSNGKYVSQNLWAILPVSSRKSQIARRKSSR